MMNNTVEAIKNGQKVTMEEVFELVNVYNMTNLSLHDSSNAILKMQVNHFESYGETLEFSQWHTEENMCTMKKSNIISTEARYDDETDSVFVTCQVPNDKKMSLTVFCVSKDFSVSGLEGYHEMDLESLHEFLESTLGDDAEYGCSLVHVTDKFSMDLKIYPDHTYIDTLDDSDWKLHVDDGGDTLEISVMDDDCNAFYRKEGDLSVEIVINPYGQPFTEVRMLFFKRNK